jgi:ribonuclease HI
MKETGIVIHTDGGARGNPGPSACAFVIEDNGKIIHKGSKNLGINTNNFAEYSAVLLALEWIKNNMPKFAGKPICLYSDSELMVRQLNGIYKIKNENLKILNEKISSLVKKLNLNICYKHVLRHNNKTADQLVNEELDR